MVSYRMTRFNLPTVQALALRAVCLALGVPVQLWYGAGFTRGARVDIKGTPEDTAAALEIFREENGKVERRALRVELAEKVGVPVPEHMPR